MSLHSRYAAGGNACSKNPGDLRKSVTVPLDQIDAECREGLLAISDAALNLIEAGHCDVIPDLGDTLDTTSDFLRAGKLFLSEDGA